MVAVRRNGVLGVVVVVILQLFPITVRDVVVVHGLWLLWRLYSGPLPLCMCAGTIVSLMELGPRLGMIRIV